MCYHWDLIVQQTSLTTRRDTWSVEHRDSLSRSESLQTAWGRQIVRQMIIQLVRQTLFNPVGEEGSLKISSCDFATICRRAE